jgi:uncharacterized protein (TIGR03382 family)
MSPAGCVLPESTPTGAGFILVDVDAAGANSDVNPVNDLATATISVTAPPPKPNLVLGTLVSTRDARPGQLLEISYDVQNSGGSATPATVTRIWISDDTIPGPGDVVLCDDLFGALAPGQSSERSIGNCALSLLIAEGEWYLVAQVDADGQSAESLEIDNFDANALTISAGDTGTTDAPTDDATDLPEDDTDGSDIDVPDITNGPIGCSCATPAGTPWWPLALASGAAALRRRRVR